MNVGDESRSVWKCLGRVDVLRKVPTVRLGSSPSGISDILHNVISCACRDNFEIPAGRSRRRFGGWKFSPPFQRCRLRRKMASMLKKTPKIEYMFSSCISILSKKEYTTFFRKFSFWLRRHRVWVRATELRNRRPEVLTSKFSNKSYILYFTLNRNIKYSISTLFWPRYRTDPKLKYDDETEIFWK